jgi:hypothetical protein
MTGVTVDKSEEGEDVYPTATGWTFSGGALAIQDKEKGTIAVYAANHWCGVYYTETRKK